jgi:small subunit ribosomal protein S4
MVNHGHFKLNGHRADIASMMVRAGDVITVKERSKKIALLKEQLDSAPHRASWMEVNSGEMTVRIAQMPTTDALPVNFDTQLVVEYYSKRL